MQNRQGVDFSGLEITNSEDRAPSIPIPPSPRGEGGTRAKRGRVRGHALSEQALEDPPCEKIRVFPASGEIPHPPTAYGGGPRPLDGRGFWWGGSAALPPYVGMYGIYLIPATVALMDVI